MSSDEEIFWQLGRDTRTGEPLPPPFCHVSAKDVARVIHDDLTKVGLSCRAIRKIACALLGVSARTKLSPPRRIRGEKQ
jgi:hypothetical protein